MKITCLTLLCGAAALLIGCGQKGALYLPDQNAAVVTRPAGAATAPTPAATPAPATQSQQNQGGRTSSSSSSSSSSSATPR